MSAFDDFKKWLVTAGLYQKHVVARDDLEALARGLDDGINMDCYCPSCKNTSTFSVTFSKSFTVSPAVALATNGPSVWQQARNYIIDALPTIVSIRCARDENHTISFWLAERKVGETLEIRKWGQIPSQHDLAANDLRRYSALLDAQDMREMQAASICSASGYHVAAFVYLRRVFERRIEVAHGVAARDTGWVEADYNKLFFMEDRIQMLKTHLPPFLVEHRKVYHILSVGIHELSEEECQAGYDVVRVAILLILDEEIEARNRAKQIAEAGLALQRLGDKYARGTASDPGNKK